MPAERQRYIPLDGLRGLAITAVFCFHYRLIPHSPGEWGWTGVDLFFALSGFLITGILFDSLGEQHYFRNFYMRRALRIFPLYWGLWCVLIAIMLVQRRFEAGYLLWPAYVGNYLGAWALHAGLKPLHFDVLPAVIPVAREKLGMRLGPYWSLCVEEQYYLCWPLVVWLVARRDPARRRKRLLALCLAGIAAALALRVGLHWWLPARWVRNDEVYFWTFTRADSLLAGSALALWVRKQPVGESAGRQVGRAVVLPARSQKAHIHLDAGWAAAGTALAIGGLALADWKWGLFHGVTFAAWMQTWGLTLVAAAACGVLALSLRVGWLARALAWKPLAALGRVSYGFYVFHLLFYDCDRIVMDATKPRVPAVLIHAAVFAWVWLLSWASFRWYETPFLRLKTRWNGRDEERKAAPGAVQAA